MPLPIPLTLIALLAVAAPVAVGLQSSGAAAATTTPGANPGDCPGGALTPHAPISITSDSGFTALNGVTGGSGTPSNPYVISCWSIDISTQPTANGILISGTTAHLVIRDVAVNGSGYTSINPNVTQGIGIFLASDPATDTVDHVTVSNLQQGVSTRPSTTGGPGPGAFTNSLAKNDGFGYLGNGPVTGNTIQGGGDGMEGLFQVVSANTLTGGSGFGISWFTAAQNVEVFGNTVTGYHGNGMGYVFMGLYKNNVVTDNGGNGFLDGGGGATFDSNTVSDNGQAGIDISNAVSSTETNNTLVGNGTAGIVANVANSGGGFPFQADIEGNSIGSSPFGILLSYFANDALVQNTNWLDGHQSIVRFTNADDIVDAGSSHLGTIDEPVFFHDYIAHLSLGPGPSPAVGGPCPPPITGSCEFSTGGTTYEAVTGVHWDFGDGQGMDLPTAVATQVNGPEPDVTHQYASPGNYTATLTVTATSANGQSVTLTDTTPVTIESNPPATSLLPASSTDAPWPMLGNTPDRPFYNGAESAITKANVSQLVPKWRFPTNFNVTASPAVANVNLPSALGGTPTPHKVVFDGAYDGTFYAIDAASGLPVWSDCLVSGPTDTPASCDPQYPGNANAPTDYGVIVSSPEVLTLASGQQEVLAAANATMYGLDAATGKVLWSFNGGVTGYAGEPTCPQVPGQGCEDLTYEIESSPVVVGNTVLFGIDSNAMAQKGGGIYAIDARDGHMEWFFDPGAGQAYPGSATTFSYNPKMNGPATENTCGGVWTSPAVDSSLGLLYASTANCTADPLPPYQEAIFALHITDGSPAWQYEPRAIDSLDMDFGATPNVFKLGSTDVVGAASKDGTYTLLNAQSGVLQWSTKVALGGSFGGFYNATTDGKYIYLTSALGEASGTAATPVEESFKGREYALDARTGNLVWRNYTGGITLGQNAAVNGVYFTGGLDHLLHAWDTSTGNLLTSLPLAGASSSGPAIAGGELFIGAGTGATFRSAVGACTPSNFFAGVPPPECPPAPVPVGEYGQGIWGFCISTNTTCATSIASIAGTKHPTKLTYTGDTSGDVDDPVTLSANLEDTTNPASPTPVPDEQITLGLYEQSCTATTDANGNASCSVTPNEASGSYTATATFLGDNNYQQSSTQAAFTLNTEETTLSYSGPSSIPDGGSAQLSGVLKEDGSTPIQGRAVTITIGTGSAAQSCTGATDSTGTATCSIDPVIQPLGSVPVSLSFEGDAYFKPSSGSASTSASAYTGSSGAFVIGDGNTKVGNSVTFWGNAWASSNTLSGSSSPSGFKGYATTPSPNPPACGGTWTSPTGNSKPPSTVPSYMAVIVSSKVTDPSSSAAGDVVEIVVIRTNSGYNGTLNQPGTGTVVGVICKS